MPTPGFTAERALPTSHSSFRAGPHQFSTHEIGLAPAFDPLFLQIDDTLFYCYPCMSGGPSGALVTGCCDPVASVPGGMSWSS
jgi:hypothetical protein